MTFCTTAGTNFITMRKNTYFYEDVEVRGTNLDIAEYLGHYEDIDTYIQFRDDRLDVRVGNNNIFSLVEDVQDQAFMGYGSDCDLYLGKTPSIFVRGSDDMTRVYGVLELAEYLSHYGDLDTFLHFEDDSVKIEAGGVKFIELSEGVNDYLYLGSSANIGVTIGQSGAFYLQGSTGNIVIGGGITSPACRLDVRTGATPLTPPTLLASTVASFCALNTGHTNLSIFSAADRKCRVYMGDTDAEGRFGLEYDNNIDQMNIWVASSVLAIAATSAGYVGIGLTPTANMPGLSIEAGLLTLKERTTPTADADYGKVYTKNDNKLYFQDGAGNEHEVAFAP